MKDEAYKLMREREGSYWWYRARREIICDAVARHVPPAARLLDYGCGTGATARALRDAGFDLTAADVSDHSLVACREAGLPTIDLRVEPLPVGSMDAVLACDVLEHVEDEAGLLRQLRQALRHDGRLILTVPAYEWLWSGEDYVSQHVRRYTRRSLLAAVRGAGLAPRWCSYFNTLRAPAVAGAILTKRLLAPRAMYRSNVEPLPHWLNERLYRIFRLERSALRHVRFPFGTSVLLVADRGGVDDLPPDRIGATVAGAEIDARQVLADDAQGEHLRAGEDCDQGG
ncbi:MAG TPA: class I SAM-dependent methyltransferase [Tepidisphaeraceae bacterium]|jgi:SAM-dependent methyltransferase